MNPKSLFAFFVLFLGMTAMVFSGTPTAATMSPLDTMKANVAKVMDPGEKERWNANIDLWTMKLAMKGMPSMDMTKMKAPMDTMKANVSKITEAGEKERWQMNCDLWEKWMAEKPDTAKMKESLADFKTKVAGIKDVAEKERWQMNYDLWESAL